MNDFYRKVENNNLYSSADNLKFKLNYLFSGVDFQSKRMLEIGGGIGLFSIYGACMGASEVVCLEPEADGSGSNLRNKFDSIMLGFVNQAKIEFLSKTFQEYESEGKKFDIILLHNSINHLNEEACITLKYDNNARIKYLEYFKKLYYLSNLGAKIIIHDCSRYNFFPLLKIKHPIHSNIEWNKHQSPNTWASLLLESGFTNPLIRWTSYNPLRTIGKILLGNKIAAFFLSSQFCLTIEKKQNY